MSKPIIFIRSLIFMLALLMLVVLFDGYQKERSFESRFDLYLHSLEKYKDLKTRKSLSYQEYKEAEKLLSIIENKPDREEEHFYLVLKFSLLIALVFLLSNMESRYERPAGVYEQWEII